MDTHDPTPFSEFLLRLIVLLKWPIETVNLRRKEYMFGNLFLGSLTGIAPQVMRSQGHLM